MAHLETYINKIRQAIYGRDVRESLATGIEKINEEVEENTTLVENTHKDIKNFKELTSKEFDDFKNLTNKYIKNFKDTTNKELINYKDSTNKDLNNYKENTLKNINEYKDNSTNEIKNYHDLLEKAEKERVNNEDVRNTNERSRENLKNDLLTLQENYKEALHSNSTLEIIELQNTCVGIKNLLKDSKNFKFNGTDYPNVIDFSNQNKLIFKDTSKGFNAWAFIENSLIKKLDNSKYYTVSLDIKIDGEIENTLLNVEYYNYITYSTKLTNTHGKWKRFYVTISPCDKDTSRVLIELRSNYPLNISTIEYRDLKISEGRGKSDWMPALEDYDEKYSNIHHNHNSNYAPLREFNDMKDQMIKNKPIVISNDTPIGTIVWYTMPGNGLESGEWQICDGRELNKSDFKELYSLIGGKYGETSNTFKVPDLLTDKKFIRSCNQAGTDIGTVQQDEIKKHQHNDKYFHIEQRLSSGSGNYFGNNECFPLASNNFNSSSKLGEGGNKFSFSREVSDKIQFGGDETRPINISLLPIIKAKSRTKDMISVAQEVENAKGGYSSLRSKIDSKVDKKTINGKLEKRYSWYRIGTIRSDGLTNLTMKLTASKGTEYFTSVNFAYSCCNGYCPQLLKVTTSTTHGGAVSMIRVLSKGWNTSYIEVYTDSQDNVNFSLTAIEGEVLNLSNPQFVNSMPDGYVESVIRLYDQNISDVTGTNGWAKFPNGVLEQWGYVQIDNPALYKVVNLPIAYSDNCYNIQTTCYYSTNDYKDSYCGEAKKDRFSIGCTGSGVSHFYWRTVGKV